VFIESFECGLHGLVLPQVEARSTLYGFSANCPKSNSMNVVVCSNPSQKSRNLAGHIAICFVVCVQSFGCGLYGLVLPQVVAGSNLYVFVQITQKSNSMNVVVCRNPSQTS
jgi:hypothetical protein